jgi:hypothetical protein
MPLLTSAVAACPRTAGSVSSPNRATTWSKTPTASSERPRALSTQARRAASEAVPVSRAISRPSRSISIVGAPSTSNRWESCGETSTFTLTSFTCPARSRASWSSTGLTIRQGPDQGAHRSTRTGILAPSATSPKVASSAPVIHGSCVWHLPQRGVPAAAAGT